MKHNLLLSNNFKTSSQAYLQAAIESLRQPKQRQMPELQVPFDVNQPPAFVKLSEYFNLDSFEQKLLLLCADSQLNKTLLDLYADGSKSEQTAQPNLDIAYGLFNQGKWQVMSAQSPLRYWNLLRMDKQQPLYSGYFNMDESILHYLCGEPCLDATLQPLLKPINANLSLVKSYQQIVNEIKQLWQKQDIIQSSTVIHLKSYDRDMAQKLAAIACQQMGLQLYCLNTRMLANDIDQLHCLVRLLEREVLCNRAVYLFEETDEIMEDHRQRRNNRYLLEELEAHCLIISTQAPALTGRRTTTLLVDLPTYDEQVHLWQHALATENNKVSNSQLTNLASQFKLSAYQIDNICQHWRSTKAENNEYDELWSCCRRQNQQNLQGLARIIDPGKLNWQELILPEKETTILHSIVNQIAQRHQVYQQWGFGEKSSVGLGISALFAGSSGTGKTLAARIIASELKLDIYHIDLSTIIDKYIGETEKKLEKVFSAAENSGAILLFDEADALFGKRSQVKDSHDRYANAGVSYLLQRMEMYQGLSILTTNFKSALDSAFVRRLRFIIQFPFPSEAQRLQIWKNVFPPKVPLANIAWEKLARLVLSGGVIRNIALNAAFQAASLEQKVSMANLLKATKYEFIKAEKTLPANLVADW